MPEQNTEEKQDDKQEEQEKTPITLTWVLVGMLAIAVMWALSSMLFK